jgi:hypothetical protein
MSDFFGAALSFPTVLFTPMLVVVVGFWAIVVGGGADPEAEHGGHVEPLGFLGLGGVPVSVPVSLLVLFAWFASLAGSQLTALPSWLVLIAALLSAWVLTRPAVLALRRLLPSGPDVSRADFIIVGGDSVFFDKLLGSITMGKPWTASWSTRRWPRPSVPVIWTGRPI